MTALAVLRNNDVLGNKIFVQGASCKKKKCWQSIQIKNILHYKKHRKLDIIEKFWF